MVTRDERTVYRGSQSCLDVLPVSDRHCFSPYLITLGQNFPGPYNISRAKVNEEHTRQGLGKLLLAAAELHSRRCLAAATHMGTTPFKCWAKAT